MIKNHSHKIECSTIGLLGIKIFRNLNGCIKILPLQGVVQTILATHLNMKRISIKNHNFDFEQTVRYHLWQFKPWLALKTIRVSSKLCITRACAQGSNHFPFV
jgi:hypothetical protein